MAAGNPFDDLIPRPQSVQNASRDASAVAPAGTVVDAANNAVLDPELPDPFAQRDGRYRLPIPGTAVFGHDVAPAQPPAPPRATPGGFTDPQQYAEIAKGIIPGLIQSAGTTLQAPDALGARAQQGANKFGAGQLDVMDRVDRGESVPEMDDALGYQHMSPEQKAIERARLIAAQQAFAPTPVQDRTMFKAGESVQQFGRGLIPAKPGYEDSFGRQVGEGLGSVAFGLPVSAVAGPFAGAAVFGSMGVGEATQRAADFDRKERAAGRPGLTQDQITAAGMLGIGPGTTDILPVEVLLGRLPVRLPAVLMGPLAQGIARIGSQALIEGVQEGGQSFLQDLIAREVYNSGQQLGENFWNEASVGAGVGGLTEIIRQVGTGMVRSAAGRRGGSASQPQVTQEPAQRQEPELALPDLPKPETPPAVQETAIPANPRDAAPGGNQANPFSDLIPANTNEPINQPWIAGLAESIAAQREADKQAATDQGQAPVPPANEPDFQPDIPIPRRVVTPDGSMEIEATPELVELDDLQFASGALQPRDRTRAEYAQGARERAANLDPLQLQPSRVSDTGAPIVLPDGTVLSGNGRTMSIAEVYRDPALASVADQYRASLGPAAQGMRQPVLVMRAGNLTPQQATQFADLSNRGRIAQMSATERALRDAQAMGLESVALYEGGDFNAPQNQRFMREFMSRAVTATERPSVSRDGRLTIEGEMRMRAAVLAAAYDDADVLARMLESTDDNIKSIVGGLLDAAPRMAQLRAGLSSGEVSADMNPTPALMEAVRTIADLRSRRVPIQQWLSQMDAFGRDPVVEAWVKAFYYDNTKAKGREKVGQLLNDYAAEAVLHRPGGLFADDTTASNVLDLARRKNDEGRDVGSAAGAVGEGVRQSGRGNRRREAEAGSEGTGSEILAAIQAAPSTLEREARELLRDAQRYERDLRASGATAEQIAQEFTKFYGAPVSAQDMETGNTWWSRLPGELATNDTVDPRTVDLGVSPEYMEALISQNPTTEGQVAPIDLNARPAQPQQVRGTQGGSAGGPRLTPEMRDAALGMAQQGMSPQRIATELRKQFGQYVRTDLVDAAIAEMRGQEADAVRQSRIAEQRANALAKMIEYNRSDAGRAAASERMKGVLARPEMQEWLRERGRQLGAQRAREESPFTPEMEARLASPEYRAMTAKQATESLRQEFGEQASRITAFSVQNKRIKDERFRTGRGPGTTKGFQWEYRDDGRSPDQRLAELITEAPNAATRAEILNREFGGPGIPQLTAKAVSRRWDKIKDSVLRAQGEEPMFAAGGWDPRTWLDWIKDNPDAGREDATQSSGTGDAGSQQASSQQPRATSDGSQGSEASSGSRADGVRQSFRVRDYLGRVVDAPPNALGLRQQYLFLHPPKITWPFVKSAATTLRNLDTGVPNWMAKAHVSEIEPGVWQVIDFRVRKKQAADGLTPEFLDAVQGELGDIRPPDQMKPETYQAWRAWERQGSRWAVSSVDNYVEHQGMYYSPDMLREVHDAARDLAVNGSTAEERNRARREFNELSDLVERLPPNDDAPLFAIQTASTDYAPTPPADRSAYIDEIAYNRLIRDQYVDQNGTVKASSREVPLSAELPPVGSWRISRMKGLYGHDIGHLVRVPVSSLQLPELVDGKLDPIKRGDDERYAQWLKVGKRPPPIEIVQTERGTMRVMDGHRRALAAKLAGVNEIEAWVSYSIPTGKVGSDGKPIMTGLTFEMANPEGQQFFSAIQGPPASEGASSGLDMSPEAKKARAEAMGFDTSRVWYHGTNKDFDAFDLGQFGTNTLTQDEAPAIFFTTSPKNAGGYAEGWGAQARDGANIRPVYLKSSNFDEWDLGGGALKPDLLKQAIAEAKADGRDGVIFRRALDMARQVAPGGEASRNAPDVVAVFDPKNIRSINAAFDPAEKSSANLMAAVNATPPARNPRVTALNFVTKMKRPVTIPERIVSGVHKALGPHMDMVPPDTAVGVLTKIEPLKGKGNADALLVFAEADGSLFDVPVVLADIIGTRAITIPDLGAIGFLRFDLAGDLGSSLRGELGHEVTHVLRRQNYVAAPAWSRLVAQGNALGVLDSDYRTYLQQIGNANYSTVPAGQTGRDLYEWLYRNSPPAAMRERLDQETVAHMLELYNAGQLFDPKMWADPGVAQILDAILDGAIWKVPQEEGRQGELGLEAMAAAQKGKTRLSALHNLSDENLAFADKMGGIAAPSIAVVKEGMGIEDGAFGNITLIGRKDLGDPAQNPVFDADAWTVRFPKAEYRAVPSAKAQKFVDALRPYAAKFNNSMAMHSAWDEMVNTPDPERAVQTLLRSEAAQAMFLDKVKGREVQPVMRAATDSMRNPWAAMPSFQNFIQQAGGFNHEWRMGSPEWAALSRAARVAIDEWATREAKGDPDLKELLSEGYFTEDGQLPFGGPMTFIAEDLKKVGQQEVDKTKSSEVLSREIKPFEAEFKSWIENTIVPLYGEPRIKVGGKYQPYTLENILEVMTGKRSIKAQEKHITFGPGKARADAAHRMKTLEEARSRADWQMGTPEEVTEASERAEKLMDAWRNEVVNYNTYVRANAGQRSGFGSTWEALDGSMRALAAWAKRGKLDAASLRSALAKEDFTDIPSHVLEDGVEAGKAFLEAPVPYFESKPQRAVQLNEFAGAVVPEWASPETLAILDKHGIPYRTYAKQDQNSQAQAAAKFAQDLAREGRDTLFATQRPRFRDQDSLGYYSQALEASRSLKQAKGTPEQMLAQLKSAGVKDAEIEATNLKGFIDGKKSVTRDEIVSHLEGNRVGLKERQMLKSPRVEWEIRPSPNDPNVRQVFANGEQAAEFYPAPLGQSGFKVELEDGSRPVILGSEDAVLDYVRRKDPAVRDETKWSSYSLDPSNPTYRETVLHLPEDGRLAELRSQRVLLTSRIEDPAARREQATRRAGVDRQIAEIEQNTFHSGHFPEPNIIGHMMTSMTKHEGQPVYTIDQIQSDWGQKLRDGGVRDEAKIAELERLYREANAKALAMEADRLPTLTANGAEALTKQKFGDAATWATLSDEQRQEVAKLSAENATRNTELNRRMDTAGAESDRLEAEWNTARNSAPGHPLVNTTDQWTVTTLRRAIRQAAEADASYIAIPSGDTVLSYNPGDRDGMIGFYGSKSYSNEAIAQARSYYESLRKGGAAEKADELEAKLDAELAKSKEGIVPKNLRKLIEKLDKDAPKPIKVNQVETPSKGMAGSGFTLFPLTDKIKAEVLDEGQPLFAFGGLSSPGSDINSFATAVIMAKRGASPDEIWEATGWYKDKDGQWLNETKNKSDIKTVADAKLHKSREAMSDNERRKTPPWKMAANRARGGKVELPKTDMSALNSALQIIRNSERN